MQTILIVDDEPNIVEGLASQLQQNYGDRAIVLRAYSGTHALSILRENQVDVVLSDICMPDLDGLSLMEETESLWPRAHFIFLSGFDDFQYIHRASKSPLYRGYLLKMEGDEVVLQKVDQEIRLCEEEARAELEQEEARRQVERMQAFLQRAALESVLRGGSAWAHMADRFPHGFSGLETSAPVILILGKVRQRTVSDTLDMLVKIDRLLALRLTRFRFVSLLPEEGAPVWLMQRGGVLEAADASYLYALFESIQQRLAETEGAHVSFVVGSACGLAEIAEKYTLVKRIYAFSAFGQDHLVMADEATFAQRVLGKKSRVAGEQLRFSQLLQRLRHTLENGTAEEAHALLEEAFARCPRDQAPLRPEQLLTLFGLLLQMGREMEPNWSGESTVRALINQLARSGSLSRERLQPALEELCAQLCRLRDLRNAHDAQAVVARINRCIEQSVESYDLSLTGLARMIGFNPSYLSRFYRINTGRKLSEQIDAAKLQHAKRLLAGGELIKNVAERTGFASPSAFILFFKRNTGMTPGQFCEQATEK